MTGSVCASMYKLQIRPTHVCPTHVCGATACVHSSNTWCWLTVRSLQGMFCYTMVMGFMFALSDIPEVQVAIAQPLVPALALGMGALAGSEPLSVVSGSGIVLSIAGASGSRFLA
jgi:EamA-like transporter family